MHVKEYEIFFTVTELANVNREDELRLKIFNETEFVELEVKNFVRTENNDLKFRCESKVFLSEKLNLYKAYNF